MYLFPSRRNDEVTGSMQLTSKCKLKGQRSYVYGGHLTTNQTDVIASTKLQN